jgi:hypothetical protein
MKGKSRAKCVREKSNITAEGFTQSITPTQIMDPRHLAVNIFDYSNIQMLGGEYFLF